VKQSGRDTEQTKGRNRETEIHERERERESEREGKKVLHWEKGSPLVMYFVFR
jgi:hypothetical protein